mgnify:FL=1
MTVGFILDNGQIITKRKLISILRESDFRTRLFLVYTSCFSMSVKQAMFAYVKMLESVPGTKQ